MIVRDAITFVTYLWHYLVARFVYDQVVRPVLHGHLSTALVACGVGVAAFAIGRWSGRHSTRRTALTGRRRP